jgi:hypothetical protein
MAGWKKIIVSGSSAELLNISASGMIHAVGTVSASEVATKKLIVTGSGEISASGLLLENDLEVQHGGTGVSSFTQGGVLIGGADASISASAALTDGELLIGHTANGVPTAAVLTQTANQVIVTNTAGGITLSTPQDIATTSNVVFGHISGSSISASAINSDGIDPLIIGGNDTTGVTNGIYQVRVTGSFTGSFSGDGTGLSGVSTVGALDDLDDVEATDFTAGRLLVADGADSFDSVTIGGDATLASNGALTISDGKVLSSSLAPGINLQVGDVTGSTISASGGITASALDVVGNSTFTGTSTFTGHSTFADPITGSRGAVIEGSLRTYTAADNSTRNIGLHVTQDVSASGFVGDFFEISSSILVTSESTAFGNDVSDTHTFQGDIVTALTGSTIFADGAAASPNFTGADGVYSYLSGSGISGSTSMNVDFRSALGGVTGSFFGPLRGPTSESLAGRIVNLEGGSGTTLSAGAISGAIDQATGSFVTNSQTGSFASSSDVVAIQADYLQASDIANMATTALYVANTATSSFASSSDVIAIVADYLTASSTASFASGSDVVANTAAIVAEVTRAGDAEAVNAQDISAAQATASGVVTDFARIQNVDKDGAPEFTGLTIKGDFTVEGSTIASETIINTTTIAMEDNIILLNSGSGFQEGDASIDAGIQIERGVARGYNTQDVIESKALNANLFWDETAARWATILSEKSGSKVGATEPEIEGNAQFSGDIQYLATVSHSDGGPSGHYYGSNASNETAYKTRYGQIHIDSGSGDIWIYGA